MLLLALVACSRSRATPDPSATRPLEATAALTSAPSLAAATAAPLADASPSPTQPTIELRTPGSDAHKWSLEAAGLPAISADGAQVVMVVEHDADQRGYPNDAIYVRRVSDDFVVQQLVGFDGYALGSADDGAARPAIEKRAAALHALLAREPWAPMQAATPTGTNTFVQGDYRFSLDGTHATLAQKGGPTATFDTSMWKKPDILPDSMSSSTCTFTAELAKVHIAPKARVVAVSVRQRVHDAEHTTGCGSPDDTHVLHW